jgi:hypothetical protein
MQHSLTADASVIKAIKFRRGVAEDCAHWRWPQLSWSAPVIPFRGRSNGGTPDEETRTCACGCGDADCKCSDFHELRLGGTAVRCARPKERNPERRPERRRLGRRSWLGWRSRLARWSRLAWRSWLARRLLLARSRLGRCWCRRGGRCTYRRCGGRPTGRLRPAGRLCASAAWILCAASAGVRFAAGDPAAEVTVATFARLYQHAAGANGQR